MDKLKEMVEKTRELEQKFWDEFDDEDSMVNDLLDLAVVIMRRKGNIITELNAKIAMLEHEKNK